MYEPASFLSLWLLPLGLNNYNFVLVTSFHTHVFGYLLPVPENAPYESEGPGMCDGHCGATPSSGVRYQLPCCCQSGKCPWQQGTASLKVTSLSKTDDWLVQGPNRLPQCGTMLKGHPAPESSIQSAEATAVTAPQLNQPCLLTSLAFLTSTHVYLPGTPINTASLGNSWSQRLIPEIPITSSPSNPFS